MFNRTKLTTNFNKEKTMQQYFKYLRFLKNQMLKRVSYVDPVLHLVRTTQAKLASYLKDNLVATLYITTICMISFISPAQADWFKVGDITANLITPLYTLVNDNLGFVAFAVGGAATFLARGADMYQKAVAFGVGSLGTAGAVKLAQTVLHLG